MQAFLLMGLAYLAGRGAIRVLVIAAAIALSVAIWVLIDDAVLFVSSEVAAMVDPVVGGYVIRIVGGLAYIGFWNALSSIIGAFLIVATVRMAYRFIGWMLG